MSDNLIRSQDAVSRMSDLICELKSERLPTWDEVYNAMSDLPSIQPEQKTGRWMHDEEHQGDIHCSLCDEIIVVDDESWANAYFRFCPYCGARMEK